MRRPGTVEDGGRTKRADFLTHTIPVEEIDPRPHTEMCDLLWGVGTCPPDDRSERGEVFDEMTAGKAARTGDENRTGCHGGVSACRTALRNKPGTRDRLP